MGIFNRLKGSENSEPGASGSVNWTMLESPSQLERILEDSAERPQLLFKNSTTCGISSIVRRSLESNLSGFQGEADLFLLHVQHHRDLSNKVADTFGVRHESPQLLVIKDGRLISHASHGAITAMDPQNFL